MARPGSWSAIRKTRSREPRSPTSSAAPSRSIPNWSSSRASWRNDCSQHPSRLQCCGQSAVVEVVELAADRHTLSEPRDLDPVAGDALGDVVRGGWALDCGIERQDKLLAGLQPPDEAVDVEVLGADSVECGERAAEHVITAAKGSGAFQCPEVGKIFDHADRRLL